MKRHDGPTDLWTDGQTDGRTDPLIEMRGRRIHGSISRGGWAGAVMCWAGAVGGPVYTTASVTCDWAGAEMQKTARKAKGYGPTDRRTESTTKLVAINWAVLSGNARTARKMPRDGRMDGRTDTMTYMESRSPRLKTQKDT